MSLKDERLARQQERFRNKGGLSKFEKSANKLVLNLNPVILKPEHVEERVPPPQSLAGPLADSTAVVKTLEDVAAPTTYSNPLLRPVSNPLPVPSTAPPRQRATKPKASSSRPRKLRPTKKKLVLPPAKEVDQSDDDELALIVAPGLTPHASTRKSNHTTTAKPAPTKGQGPAKPVDDGAMEVQSVLKEKRHAKPSRALKQAEAEVSPPKKGPSEPSPSALKLPKHKKTGPRTVLRPEQRPETEGNVKHCATEAPSTRTQKRKTRAEELPAERPECSGKAAVSRSGIILSCPVVADGDENEAIQEPPKKQRRRVLVDQPCTWDAEDQAPRRVLKLPGHK